MNKLATAIAITMSVVASGTCASGRAEALPLGAPDAMREATGQVDPIQNVQVFVWHGRRYCWYDDGWHGPGFYWCGYAWRSGIGWGGGVGWHGWRVHGHHREVGRREFERHERRDVGRHEFERRGGREFERRGRH